jgi:hypothetical protein
MMEVGKQAFRAAIPRNPVHLRALGTIMFSSRWIFRPIGRKFLHNASRDHPKIAERSKTLTQRNGEQISNWTCVLSAEYRRPQILNPHFVTPKT